MEALVMIGLIGLGLISNNNEDSEEGNNHVTVDVDKEVHLPTSDNLYHSDFYNESQKMINNKAMHNFESSYEDGNKVVNNQKLNRLGSGYLEESDQAMNDINEVKENFSDYIYSNATDEYTRRDEFLKNDQGITAQPFFRKAPTEVDLNDTRQLDRHQGDNQYNVSKREVGFFFELEKDLGNVHGNTFGEYIGDKSRYNDSLYKTSELPFQQERVSNIDVKSNLNREIGQIHADRNSIDALRSKNDPKLTYKGTVLAGKNLSEKRGLEGETFNHRPEKYYENNEDRYFVTNGAYLEKSGRPEEIMKDTFRSKFNNQPLGPAAANYSFGEKRSNYKKSSKMQLPSDTTRNVGASAHFNDKDFSREGYRALPNEREVTGSRVHNTNLSTDVSNHKMGLFDDPKETKKQMTINSKNNGYIANTSINNTVGLMDSVKTTKKQTTINTKNNGYLKGPEQLTNGYESPEMTTKDSTLFSYTGIGGGDVKGNLSNENYMNAETNPTKEIIAQGRTPTLNNTKIVNGVSDMNVDIKKLHTDYLNYRENGIHQVHERTADPNNMGDVTTMKNKLEDRSISQRIDGNLLDPFKNNPYTQPLTSFAY